MRNFSGRLEWLWTLYKYEICGGKERTLPKILAISQHTVVMLKIEARSVCTRTRGCSLAPAMNKSKKITSKLGLGFNFAVIIDFWLCNDGFNKKTEGKNVIFVVFL